MTGERAWSLPFTLLASRQTRPLWPAAGLPEAITHDPVSAIGAARELLLAFKKVASEEAAREAVVRAFERIEADYGSSVADAVDVWSRRHFVRRRPYDDLDAWKAIFLSVTGAPERWLNLLAEAHGLRERVAGTLATAFREPYDRIVALERLAEAQEPSPLERSLNRLESSPADSLTHFPVVAMAATTATRESTIVTWRALDASLSGDEVASVIRWARQIAPQLRVTPDDLRHPVI